MTEEAIVNLDSILNDKPAEQVEKVEDQNPPEEQQETEGVEGEPPAPEEVKDEYDGKTHVPVKTVLEERRKRQALEAELKAIKENQNTQKAEPEPEDNSDDGEVNIDDPVKSRRNISVNIMKTVKPDYEEKEAIFLQLVEKNPSLIRDMDASGNPALFAYEKATEHLQFQEYLANKDSPEFLEFMEAKKSGKLDESPAAKRNKSALSVPNLINTSSAKVSKPVTMPTLDDILD
jgi:phage terminase small subunit